MWATTIVFLLISLTNLAIVVAPPPPSNPPIPIPQYGVTTVYASEGNQPSSGAVNIKITSNGYGAFFVVKLLVFMDMPGQSDLILESINLDGVYAISFSQNYATPKIVVIASGATFGDVIGALPSYLTPMLVRDPLGNEALVLNGGAGNGLTVGLQFSSQTIGGQVSAEAIVTAPSNNTITIAMS